MQVRFYTSFDRSYRSLRPLERGKADYAVQTLLTWIEERRSAPPQGLGFKKLRSTVWEIRVDLRIRIVFTLEGDCLSFLLVGTHDDVRRFLRNPHG